MSKSFINLNGYDCLWMVMESVEDEGRLSWWW